MEKKDMINRNVRFDYFQLYCIEKNDEGKKIERLFDFFQWMNVMNDIEKINDRTITYNTERIRIDNLRIEPKTEYGLVHFARLRQSNVPSITALTRDNFKDVTLKADEYLAEDISALYDQETHVLMLQRNIHSLSPTGVADYINYFWNRIHENQVIELRPVMKEEAFKYGFGKKVYKKLIVKTADTGANQSGLFDNLKNPFAKAFSALDSLDGVNIEITVTSSRSKESLDFEQVIKTLKELEDHQGLLKKVQVSAKETEDTKVEKIDLIDGKVSSVLPFNIPIKTSLAYDSVQTSMLAEYNPKENNKKKVVDYNLLKKKK